MQEKFASKTSPAIILENKTHKHYPIRPSWMKFLTTNQRLLVETVRGKGKITGRNVLHTIMIVILETNFIIVFNVIPYKIYKRIFLVYILLSETFTELMSTQNDAMLKKNITWSLWKSMMLSVLPRCTLSCFFLYSCLCLIITFIASDQFKSVINLIYMLNIIPHIH